MEKNCVVGDCIWSDNSRFCEALEQATVPLDKKWPLLVLYLRGISETNCLSEIQKSQMQDLLIALLQKKDFSEQHFNDLQNSLFAIITSAHEEKLQGILREASELARDMSSLFGKRQEELSVIAQTADTTLSGGVDPVGVLAQLRDAIKDVVVQMQEDVRFLASMTNTDSLSGLANRRAFDAFLAESVELWQEKHKPVSLLLMDIDFFKNFNDTYGHLIGDQVIRALAVKISKVTESMFGSGRDILIARYGGEEFAVVLRGEPAQRASELAEAIRAGIADTGLRVSNAEGKVMHRGLKVTVSVGTSALWEGWKGAYQNNLIDFADKALYYTKLKGRNLAMRHVPGKKKQFVPCGDCPPA